MAELENINPNVYKKSDERKTTSNELDESVADPIDEREVFGRGAVQAFSLIYFTILHVLD